MPGPNMSIWSQRDVYDLLQNRLDDQDIANIRAASKDCKGCVDSTLARLKPVNLDCRLLHDRALPGLKSLHISQLQHLKPTQLQQLGSLMQLTALHIGGPASHAVNSSQLDWIGHLTNLKQLSVTKFAKVRLNVLQHWHSLKKLQNLSLIGVAFSAADAPNHLQSFLAAGAAASLTSLVLGDQQGLNFLSDRALEGLGQLLGPVGKLKMLDLSGCIELTDQGFKYLSGLSSLTNLQLPNCMKIGAGAVQQVAKFTQLKSLNLRGCSQLHDQHVRQLLLHLTDLKTLNLQACSSLTGSFLSEVDLISCLVNLGTLNLAYCPGLYPSNLHLLTALPALQHLELTGGAAVSGVETLLLLGKLQGVTKLVGGHWRCKGAAGGLQTLLHSSNTSTSSTPVPAVPQAAAAAVADVQYIPLLPPKLEFVAITHLSCSESFLETLINSLPKTLKHLDLSSCTVSGFSRGFEKSLKGLEQCSNLRSLNLSGTSGKLGVSALGFMSKITTLTELKVDRINSSMSEVVAAAEHSGQGWNIAAATDGTSSSSSDGGGWGGGGGGTSSCVSVRDSSDISGCFESQISINSSSRNASPPVGVAALLVGTACTPSKAMLASSSSSSSSSRGGCSTALKSGELVKRNLFPGAAIEASALLGRQTQQQQQHEHPFSHMLRLQQLSISFSSYVDDTVLANLSGLTHLASLELIACRSFSGSGFSSWTLLHGLTSLNLSGCSGLTDEGLGAVAGSCLGLRELLLAGCREVTDEGVGALQQLTGLRRLNLASNRHVSSRSMAALFPRLRHLSHLGLSLCSSMDDEALRYLALAPGLTEADLRGCWKITDEGVHALLSHSPMLLLLNVDNCHRLSANCCSQHFTMSGHESFNTHQISSNSSPGSSNGHWRPGALFRIAMPQSNVKTAAAVAVQIEDVMCSQPDGASRLDTAAAVKALHTVPAA